MPAFRRIGNLKLMLSALAVALTALVPLSVSGAAPTSALASGADSYCVSVTLGHFGGPNDFCVAPSSHLNTTEFGFGLEHSVCVSTTTNGEKSGVNVAWACSSGGGSEVRNEVNGSVQTQSIIRNNDTGDSVNVSAQEVFN
jgi:hypothetical protein